MLSSSLRRLALHSLPSSLPPSSPSPSLSLLSRNYNFASKSFRDCYGNLPVPDGKKLREDTVAYLDEFNPKVWYEDPITSVVGGRAMMGGKVEKTVDAFEKENGFFFFFFFFFFVFFFLFSFVFVFFSFLFICAPSFI